MSTTIDERVVEMRFNNQNFENNARTSMSTLEKLKQSLKLNGATQGLENIDNASKKINFSGLTNGVEAVQAKFSYFQATVQHQLNNIVDSAVSAGKRMASALTIDPIKTGFQEYETQINAVQTILANTESKGSTLQDVNRALNELNTYADKTIYNFTEMTRNIGTFTAAGIDLDTSVSAIQGIANLAAVSGSTSQQASTAMYQLSQALASGTVKLMDWNSVVNAGMGGQVFQDALKQTARVHGVAIDQMIKDEGSFRETLAKGWLTKDILTETLNQFTMAAEEGSEEWEAYKKSLMDTGYSEGQATSILKLANTATDAATKVKTFTQLWDTLKEAAQSGWTKSWEIMIGDFEEAKDFLTDISDRMGEIIGNSADARNAVLSEGLSTGWKQLLNAGIADEDGYREKIKTVAKDHGVAIDDMIASEKKLDETLTDKEAFQKVLTKGLKDGTLTSDMLSESVHKMADEMSSMSTEELKAAGYTVDYVKQIKDLSAGLKDGSISMDDFVKKMTRPSGRENIIQALWNSFNGLMAILKPVKEAFREVFPPMTGEQLYNITVKIRELTENFKVSEDTAAKIKQTFKGLFSVIDIGVEAVKAVGKGAIDLVKNFSGLGGKVLDSASSIGVYLTNLRDTVKETDIFGVGVEKVVSIISTAITKIKEFGKSLTTGFDSPKLDGFLSFFSTLWNIITQVGSAIGKALGSFFKTVSEVFGKGDIFEVLNSGLFAGVLVVFQKFTNGLKDGVDSVGGILENIKGILDDVRGCLQAYQEQLKANTLLKIASAIGILAASLFVISTIDPDKLAASLGAMAVLFGELIGSLKFFSKVSTELSGVTKAVGLMIGVSIAVLILAGALKKIAAIDSESIIKGLLAIGALMAELSVFLRTAKFEGKITSSAIGIVILSSAMLILAKAVKSFGGMEWGEIGKGLAAIGALLLEISLFTRLTGNAKNVASTGVAMVLLGASMKIFASAIKDFGAMDWTAIGKGLVAMGGALLEVSVAMRLLPKGMVSKAVGMIAIGAALKIIANALTDFGGMSWESIGKGLAAMGGALAELSIGLNLMKNTLAGSAALLVAALALGIMVPVMKSLGGMSWESIGKGLVTIAGAFTVIGIAGLLLKPLIPTLLGLAAAFVLFGVSTALIGAGLALIGVGITAIATALTASATSIVASLTVIIVGIVDLIPTVAKKIGEGIVEICKVVGDYAPQVADSLLKLVAETLKSLATYTPQIVDSLLDFIIGIINSLADHMPTLIVAVMNLVGAIFQGVIDALNGLDTSNLLKGVIAVGLVTALMYALSGVVALIPGAMTGLAGVGLVIAEMAVVFAAIGGLAQIPGLSWLIEEGGNFLEKIGTALGQFIGGLAGGIAKGFTSSLPEIASDLSSFMTNLQPFIAGASSIDDSVLKGVAALAGAILAITAADVITGIASFLTGGSSFSDFANQLVPFGEAIRDYANVVTGIDNEAVTASANAAKSLSELANNLPNSGGLVSLFAGDNKLSTFAKQLVPFGEGMKAYSDSVAGIKPLAITASSIAAKSLVELANNIPNSGGLVSLVTGDNKLSTFAKQLIPFGEGMKAYSDSVSGINPLAITASSIAAKSLVELTNNLPNSGGLISLVTGDNKLSTFAKQLIPFGEGMKSYSDSIAGINPLAITASSIAAKSLVELANNLPNTGGLISVFTGESSLASFGRQLVPFGEGMKSYVDSIADINPLAVTASSIAARSLVELANNLPNTGGLVTLFTGDNSIASFGYQLVPFGEGMKAYADSVADIKPESVTASANAAKTISELATSLPNMGGLVSLFVGENSLASFGYQLAPFGRGMKAYADSVAGINPESVTASANAAKALSELATNLPNAGGLVSLFAGENSIALFGYQLAPFGRGMKAYADSVAGIEPESVIASANAAKALSELATNLPNAGGLVSLFAGENSIALFGYQLAPFGRGMKAYADSVAGINPEAVTASANAAKSLSELAANLPNAGGLVSLFTGENSIAMFGYQLAPFGRGMKAYADSVVGINPDSVVASANAAKSLSELAANLPNFGGLVAMFTGENSIAMFGYQLAPFGRGMKAYADSIVGINPDAVTASANAAKTLSELATSLPKLGGLMSLLEGENSIALFGYQLVPFGKGMKAYADSVADIKFDVVSSSITQAKKFVTLVNSLTDLDTSGIKNFKIKDLGSELEDYYGKIDEIEFGTVASSISQVMRLKDLVKSLAGIDNSGVESFTIKSIGSKLKDYYDAVSGIDTGVVSTSISNANRLKILISSLAGLDTSGVSSFKTAINELGTVDISKIVSAFEGASTALYSVGAKIITSVATGMRSRLGYLLTTSTSIVTQLRNTVNRASASFKSAGVILMTQFSIGISSQRGRVSTSARGVVSAAVNTVNNHYINFYSAGKYLVEGFALGITANTFRAEAQAAAMAEAAKRAAEKALGINSPSKVFYKIGDYTGQGFVNALVDYGKTAYDSASSMANYARKGMTSAIGRIQDLINSDMDSQPTIRPVLDLSDVQSGVAYMNGLLPSSASIGVMSNLNSINSMMNRNNQNGEYGEVVSAIEGLRKDLGDTGDTYIIDGVTYDDGSAVSSAMQTIVRAAKIERRV